MNQPFHSHAWQEAKADPEFTAEFERGLGSNGSPDDSEPPGPAFDAMLRLQFDDWLPEGPTLGIPSGLPLTRLARDPIVLPVSG